MNESDKFIQIVIGGIRECLKPEPAIVDLKINDCAAFVYIDIDGWTRKIELPMGIVLRRDLRMIGTFVMASLGYRYMKFPQTWDREDD